MKLQIWQIKSVMWEIKTYFSTKLLQMLSQLSDRKPQIRTSRYQLTADINWQLWIIRRHVWLNVSIIQKTVSTVKFNVSIMKKNVLKTKYYGKKIQIFCLIMLQIEHQTCQLIQKKNEMRYLMCQCIKKTNELITLTTQLCSLPNCRCHLTIFIDIKCINCQKNNFINANLMILYSLYHTVS